VIYFTQNSLQLYGSAPTISDIASLFAFLMVFAIPILTMRLVSEENRMGTIELLLTAPLRDYELILGKWLGSFLYMLTLIVATLIYPIILNNLIDTGIDWGILASTYLGLILVAASLLSIGVGISALFTNQIAALMGTFGVGLLLWWLVGIPASLIPSAPGDIFRFLTMNGHISSLIEGKINLSDISYFLSLIALGLFTGATAVEIRRWR
jgi:ABC-2 type transport system permease protein